MTKTTDTHQVQILRYHAEAVQKFCNAQGSFWHRISIGEHPTRRPSDRAKGNAYDGAWHLTRLLDLPRASNMLDLLAALDGYNQTAHVMGLRTYRVTPRNRAAIIATVTPRS